MKTLRFLALLFVAAFFLQCESSNEKTVLNVLQFNVWQEGTIVDHGFEAIINEIIHTEADLIALSEVRNYKETNLAERMVTALKEKGFIYYSEKSEDTGILSKYPIIAQMNVYPLKNDHGSITKAIIDVKGVEIAFYSGHLDYLNCAIYLPRGYDGSTWEQLDAPITDLKEIEKINLASERDDAINAFIKDALSEQKKGRIVIYGGDNNEPSHLDWIVENKHLYDHNGVVMPWNNTINLEKNGFVDAYRKQYPNPLTHPGFTYPADNPLVPMSKLAWSPKADDRDRIDFVFYLPNEQLTLKKVKILGPKGDVSYGKRVLEETSDVFIAPLSVWPTDHKAVWVEFELSLRLRSGT
ncbi:MAG: endonuclease [Flavobacteriaceae bacterium]|nr:MAG: endonuclease [Flavobacteriaceae bacterium]